MAGKGRWVICPVVLEAGARKPLVATLIDPGYTGGIDPITGLPAVKRYRHSSAIHDSDDSWCVSFVRGVDFTPLNLDSRVTSILERDHDDAENFLDETPRSQSWTGGKVARLRNILSASGADTTGLTSDSRFWEWVGRLLVVRGGKSARGTWVR